MSTGPITLACLLLAVPAGVPADAFHTRSTRFNIPVTIDPKARPDLSEVRLFVSRDQGKTWDLHGTAKPDKTAFEFYAPVPPDGVYYFTVAVVDRQGRQDPADVAAAPVGQCIVIDTTRPEVRLTAERSGDEVAVRWSVREEYPDASTFRMEYRAAEAANGPWTPLPAPPQEKGETRFRAGPGPVVVRLQVADHAKNVGVAQAEVAGGASKTVSAWSDPGEAAPGGSPRPPLGSAADVPPPVPNPSPLPAAVPPPSPLPPPSDGPLGPCFSGGQQSVNDVATPRPAASGDQQVVALTGSPTQQISSALTSPVSGNFGGRGDLPVVRVVNKREVKLDFQVGKYGPSGVGSVDVFVTANDGTSWEQVPDPRISLPPLPDLRSGAPVMGSVTVSLPRDGVVYGFQLVVKSGAGLGKPPPRPGDLPKIRVEVDTTPPEASLFRPQADPNRRDTLLLRWEAKDRNLATNPVTLEWAPRQDGPWAFIGDPQLPNSGQYNWAVPANTPPRVYLRLTVRDTAGNTAKAETSQPVTVDLSTPEVEVINVDERPVK